MRTQNLRYRWLLGVVAVLVLGIASLAQQTEYSENKRMNMESHVNGMTGHATTGQPTYKRFCIGCHGELGDGQGENAMWIDPKPRNFTIAIFRCRSTPTGTLPTDAAVLGAVFWKSFKFSSSGFGSSKSSGKGEGCGCCSD